MKFNYNIDKEQILLKERGLSFEDVITAVNNGNLVDILKHPNEKKYPNQSVLVVRIKDYIHAVPYVIEDDGSYFLKTIFADRKLNKKYSL